MGAIDLSLFSLGLAALLLIIPITLSWLYSFSLVRALIFSTIRMSLQLILIGIFFKYLFFWNNPLLNIVWLMLMVLVAVYSALTSSGLRVSKVLLPALVSFAVATFSIVLYLNYFVIRLDNIFHPRYLIVLGGMLLGNSLRGNIIGISTFYQQLKRDHKHYQYLLSLGSSPKEATLPYLQESITLALKPTLASMAAMGIVSLPGMMTGVILGGTSPEIAIKYQIMIMLAIVVSTTISIWLTIVLTKTSCFDNYGNLKEAIFS